MKRTQLEEANERLTELRDITITDKQEMFAKYSEPTVIRYLKGRGKRLDTAIDLLQFFQKKIEEREQILKTG